MSLLTRRDEVTRVLLIQRLTSTAEENKENLVGPMTTQRKSPLPEWYPRTPLRDITGIVNALERRKIRLQAAAQVIREREASPENPPELIVTDRTPPPDSTPTTTKCVISFSSPVEHPLATPSTSSPSSSESESEEKLCRLIDQIDRIVRKNLKRIDVKNEALDKKRVMQRTTLMSMR